MDMLGDFVKHKREQKGFTQQELAEKIHMKNMTGKNYISSIERKALPGLRLETLEHILGALDCSVKFIDRNNL